MILEPKNLGKKRSVIKIMFGFSSQKLGNLTKFIIYLYCINTQKIEEHINIVTILTKSLLE